MRKVCFFPPLDSSKKLFFVSTTILSAMFWSGLNLSIICTLGMFADPVLRMLFTSGPTPSSFTWAWQLICFFVTQLFWRFVSGKAHNWKLYARQLKKNSRLYARQFFLSLNFCFQSYRHTRGRAKAFQIFRGRRFMHALKCASTNIPLTNVYWFFIKEWI